ncbi:hypothetical protein GCM10014715_57920 [Streptomyces spiralis]|uniref:Uncharacterized protein n=1 Tax=Streptomyces spiralis TaxID=66376 RepID=A0A919A9H6_9ACTN|nr:hypothetical protein GCM10014715_57920 [Streptomyces spiralis]
MQPSAIRDRVYYRCEFKEREAALYPGLDHPRTVNLREDIVCRELDTWIARAFEPDRLTATITALSAASIAASTASIHTPEQAQARQAIKESERKLARYQAALDAGADPAVVTQWINDAQRDKDAAQRRSSTLCAPPPERRKRPSPPTRSERSLRDSATSHSASKRPTPTRKGPSTRPWGSLSATTTQRGPRPSGRGPRFRIAIRSVRGGT